MVNESEKVTRIANDVSKRQFVSRRLPSSVCATHAFGCVLLLWGWRPTAVSADTIPELATYPTANWVRHIDVPAGTVPGDFKNLKDGKSYVLQATDNTDESAQHHHLIMEIRNPASTTQGFKVFVKVKRHGALLYKIKKTLGPVTLASGATTRFPDVIYDERDVFKNNSDTGKLKAHVSFETGNLNSSTDFGIAVVEDPPCKGDSCSDETVAQDADPIGPENLIVVEITDDEGAVPTVSVWGLTTMTLLLAVFATVLLGRRYSPAK